MQSSSTCAGKGFLIRLHGTLPGSIDLMCCCCAVSDLGSQLQCSLNLFPGQRVPVLGLFWRTFIPGPLGLSTDH